MKSKKRTIGILIVVIVLLLGVVSVIFLINKHNNPRNEKENISSNIYNEKVDSAIDSVLFSEDYNTLSLDEKKDRMLSILYQLEKDGDILKDSIFYQENVKTIWFQYPDGFEDGVILEEYTKGFSGSADISNYVIAWDSNGMPSIPDSEIDISNLTKPFPSLNSTNSKINFHESSYPFLEEEVKNLELSAKYMFGWCDANDTSNECYRYLADYQENKKIWNNNYLKTDIDDTCIVEDFKTGLLEYDIVFIEEHGTLLNNVPIICTREEYDKTKYKDDKKHLLFPKDNNGKRHYLIKPSFFEKYYGNGKLKDTIVWISSCHGYQYNDLAYAFEKCGASAVVGYNESILLEYDKCLQNAFVYDLMYGGTVSEALEFSKKIWTPNDKEFTNQYSQYFGNCGIGTEAKVNTNGKNARLINLAYYSNVSGTVKDENGNPIKGAEIGIHNVRGMSHGITATTNENGEYTLECPQDSYKIDVKADGYEVFETDDFVNVVYGEETIFNITLKKVIEPTKTTINYMAIDLIDKSIPEIISLMNGEYQIIQTEMGGYYNGAYSGIFYIQNQSVFPGMEFYVETLLNESVDFKGGQSTGKEIQSNGLRKNLEAGKYALDGIQVNKSGKATDSISADMDYVECSKALDNFDCIQGNGGYIGGSPLSALYTYNEKNAKIELHFIATSEMFNAFRLSENNKLSSEQMKSFNPSIMNVVIRKAETVTTNATEPPTESPTETQTEPTSELKIETGKLSDSDIKSEWQHVISLDFEYPIFTTSDNSLKEFLDTSVTNEILSYMATDSDYNLFISGGFEYDMSIDGYLSIDGWINNHPEGGQGYLGCENYTFFVDLKNRKVLSLKDLFSESEDLVYNEIREKADKYISDKRSYLMNPDALINYDYEKCKFLLTKDKLTLIFSPYEISVGAVGSVEIEIPVSDINLTCVVPEVETNGF